ncbi:mechanosensitive ion channel protein [Defluviimonas sp. 20V17]|uniref:Mechanosensitive ion channel n=1 Tax=Allgaiera indica TaxID=765699 RepID=A0AAN4UMH4_9RHOB|nr:mechanosensitive ion channel domain-containing protein [Allgaiera indica]KDB03655.1 mechanosensitive ion channel protein [Defluviimonas sp. 20V17]GHD98202.1 mechanosensitive ion channel protein [Allgaiera indica]SDW51777.1 Mechanosensitive ion channel [Allgaiera indica]
MAQLTPLMTSVQGLLAELEAYAITLLRPSQFLQLGVLIGLGVVAQLLKMLLAPRLHDWLRAREGWAKWRLRLALLVLQRLRAILFVVMAWTAYGVIAQITPFPSRRYLIGIVATIATAILVVGVATRVIRNPALRRLVTWGAWIYVTLHFLGLLTSFSNFLDGMAISFGNFRLSALSVIKALVVTGILFAGARLLAQAAEARIGKAQDISPSMRVLAVKILQVGLYGAAFFVGLKAVGFDLTGLAFLSGAVGVGLGFGLQKVVSNLVSGVIILLDKSVKPGDVISLGDTFGWIHALGARYVSVVTRDGKEYLIPNEDLITGQVVNWSHSNEFVRLDIHFGASYHDDPHKVRALAIEACQGAPRVLKTRPPVCHIVGFGDSSVDYILRFWISDPTAGLTNVRGAVFLALWDAFKAGGISIPFPQREVRLLDGRGPATMGADAAAEKEPKPE